MLLVRHGDVELDAEPFLKEALTALPFVNPVHYGLFAKFFLEHWGTGELDRVMRKSGLPTDFFVEMSGRTPRQAIQAIEHRARCNIIRQAKATRQAVLLSHPVSMRYWQTVRCVADTSHCCRLGKKTHGKVVPFADRTEFPRPGCPAEWCPCMWEPNYIRRD